MFSAARLYLFLPEALFRDGCTTAENAKPTRNSRPLHCELSAPRIISHFNDNSQDVGYRLLCVFRSFHTSQWLLAQYVSRFAARERRHEIEALNGPRSRGAPRHLRSRLESKY